MTEITDDYETFKILLTESTPPIEHDEDPWFILPVFGAGALGAGALGTELYYILTRI